MKQVLPTAVPQACPRQVGGSGCVARLCRCSQPAVRAPAQQAGCCPHSRLQLCDLLLLAGALQRCHPVLVEVCHEELGRDASEEVLQCHGLQVSLQCSLPASQELFQLQVRSAHLQDDSQQQCRLASQVDVCAAIQVLPQLPKRCPAGSSAEYPLRPRPFPL